MNTHRLRYWALDLVPVAVLSAIMLHAVILQSGAAQAACPPGYGDLNDDGQQSVVDIQCSILANLWELAGATEPQPACLVLSQRADVSCDGGLDVADVQLTIQLTLGIPLIFELDADANQCPDLCEPTTAIPAGGLVITEIMREASASDPLLGEWFEILNVTSSAVDLAGVGIFRKSKMPPHIIASSVVVDAGARAVLGRSADLALNGGVDVAYAFGSDFTIGDGSARITLLNVDGDEIDTVQFIAGFLADVPYPPGVGESLSLDPAIVDATANDWGGHWCRAYAPYGAGDRGTPGAENAPCPVCGDGIVDGDEALSYASDDPEINNLIPTPNLADDLRAPTTGSLSSHVPVAYEGTWSGGSDSDYVGRSLAPGTNLGIGTQWKCRLSSMSPLAAADVEIGWIVPMSGLLIPHPVATNESLRNCEEIAGFVPPFDIPVTNQLVLYVGVEPRSSAEPCPAAYTVECVMGYSAQFDATFACGLGDCGNGTVDLGEQCDDGNVVNGDDCNASCYQEIDPGDLIITEVMMNPAAVSDNVGEWFEVYNQTGLDIDLRGFVIRDADIDAHVISESAAGPVVVPAGGYAVLARGGDPTSNGGVEPAYVYTDFTLANGADEVIIERYGTVIDRVDYNAFAVTSGQAMSLSNNVLTAACNDLPSSFCNATDTFGAGDLGTPGAQNPDCPTAIQYAITDPEPNAPIPTSLPLPLGSIQVTAQGSPQTYLGSFDSPQDADHVRWQTQPGAPPLPQSYWSCRINDLLPGATVRLRLGSSGYPPWTSIWDNHQLSDPLQSGESFHVSLASVPWQTTSTVRLLAGVIPVTGLAPCAPNYTLTCQVAITPIF